LSINNNGHKNNGHAERSRSISRATSNSIVEKNNYYRTRDASAALSMTVVSAKPNGSLQ